MNNTFNQNFVNESPFLRTSRLFPKEIDQLAVEVTRTYIDVANAINYRIISIFAVNAPSITGEAWYLTNQRQNTLRQVFTFKSTSAINHNIQVNSLTQFVRCFGTYTDGTNSYGLIYGTNVSFNGQISFYLTTTQIVFVVNGSAPTLTSGILDIEWLVSV